MRLVVPSALLFAALAPLTGCELFGIVRCADDGDCPDALPFCEDEVCVSEEDSGRTGRGIDENNDGTCAGDSDCGEGLCYDLTDTAAHFEADRVGTCVPAAEDDSSCPEAIELGTERAAGAPVIFGATATRAGGDCEPGTQSLSVTVLFLDREGDVDPSGLGLFSKAPSHSGPLVSLGSISGDGTSGEGFFFVNQVCVPDVDDHIALRLGELADELPTSNALCVPIAAAP